MHISENMTGWHLACEDMLVPCINTAFDDEV